MARFRRILPVPLEKASIEKRMTDKLRSPDPDPPRGNPNRLFERINGIGLEAALTTPEPPDPIDPVADTTRVYSELRAELQAEQKRLAE